MEGSGMRKIRIAYIALWWASMGIGGLALVPYRLPCWIMKVAFGLSALGFCLLGHDHERYVDAARRGVIG
jgi:hypothetical protein